MTDKEASSSKRKGSHGRFKKSDAFIEDKVSRVKHERRALNSFRKNIGSLYLRSKIPAVFMAFSEGNLIGHASNPSLQRFIDDKRVQAIFQEYMCEAEFTNSNNLESTEEFSIENGEDLRLPENWKSLNAHGKRDWVIKLVNWSNHDNLNWRTPECKPSWWPEEILFRSPNNKGNRPSIHELDKILNAFITHQGKLELEDVCSQASELLRNIQNDSWENLVLSCQDIEENLKFSISYLSELSSVFREINVNEITLHLRKYVPFQLRNREPIYVNGDHSLLSAIALAFNDDINWQYLKLLSIIGNVRNIEQLKLFVTDGGYGLRKEFIKQHVDMEEDMDDKVLKSITNDIDILDLFGICFALRIDFVLHGQRDATHYLECGNRLDRTHILFMPQIFGAAVLLPAKDFNTGPSVCQHNVWCDAIPSDLFVTTCQHCLLVYHYHCTGRKDDCRCIDNEAMVEKLSFLYDHERIERRLEFFKEHINDWLTNILLCRAPTKRMEALRKILSHGHDEKLCSVNRFYHEHLPEQSQKAFIDCITKCIKENNNLEALLSRKYDLDHETEVIKFLLYPEIAKLIVKFSVDEFKATDLMLERATFHVAHNCQL